MDWNLRHLQSIKKNNIDLLCFQGIVLGATLWVSIAYQILTDGQKLVQKNDQMDLWKLDKIIPMSGSEKFWFYWKTKKISSRGPLSWRNSMFVSCVFKRRWRLSWRNSMFVSCVFKRRWRLGGRKCRKMQESDICVCRKAKVVELHIVCMLK